MSQNTKKREWKTDTTIGATISGSCEVLQGQWLLWHEGDQSWNLPSDKQFEPVWTSLNQFKPV